MSYQMDLRNLRYFEAIAELASRASGQTAFARW